MGIGVGGGNGENRLAEPANGLAGSVIRHVEPVNRQVVPVNGQAEPVNGLTLPIRRLAITTGTVRG